MHVGGQKQYIFSPLGNKTIFMQNCFIVSALQYGNYATMETLY